jgi:hypothetical protein
VVPSGCRRQAPAPLQPPARPQVCGPSAGHSPPGSWPPGIGVQVPGAPDRLQAEQVPAQAEAQQTSSTQKPVAHWPPLVQAVPLLRFSLQALFSQKNPVWQSVSPTQAEAQASSRQELGAQLVDAPGLQAPLPSHVLAAYSVAPSHLPAAHSVPAG